jgi:hypothetical protein
MSLLKRDIGMPLKFRQLFDPKNFCIYVEICIKMIVHEIISTFIRHFTAAPFPHWFLHGEGSHSNKPNDQFGHDLLATPARCITRGLFWCGNMINPSMNFPERIVARTYSCNEAPWLSQGGTLMKSNQIG